MKVGKCQSSSRRRGSSWIPAFAGMTILSLLMASPCFAEITLVEWDDLTDRDISTTGKDAFSFNKELWKHTESGHFIYHFGDVKAVDTFLVHGELYYQWIKDLFGITEDTWKKKAHVFVFEDKADWQSFLQKTKAPLLEGEAFTSGWELFIFRAAFWLSPMKTLAHELTHVILFRFLDGPVPLFLNEGFAEYISMRAIATQFGGDEFRVRTLKLIPGDKYFPLEELARLKNYPSRDVLEFYHESELLVRFIIQQKSGREFYTLLKRLSQGEDFEKVLTEITGLPLNEFEEKFKSYAIAKNA